MENAPLDSPETSDDSTSSKKKRRKSFELGKAAVDTREAKREDRPPEKESKSALSALFETKEKEKKPAEKVSETKDETVSEAEAPADGTLSEEEKQTVVKAIAQEASQDLPEHDPAENPEEAAADMLAAEFYEKLGENPDIEEAAKEVVDDAGLELPKEAGPVAEEGAEEQPGDYEETSGAEELASPGEELVFDRTAEAHPADADEEEPGASTASATGAGPTTGAGSAGTTQPGGSAGGGAVPPIRPMGRSFGGPGAPFGPPFEPGGYGSPTGPNFNAAPATPDAANVPRSAERIDDRGSPAAFFVAGGIVGYLIGRRRGRIKTEKKLLPVQKKLEQQVEDLHWQIKAKESQIRKVAAEKVRQEGPVAVEALVAKRAAKAEKQKETVPAMGAFERFKEVRQKAPEANILHAAKAPEHIGHMLMTAESVPAILPSTERASTKTNKAEFKANAEKAAPALSEKAVETLNRAELLQLSERIVVEGSSLRQIYETHLVGERGLRRLIIEHLRGGDMAKALKREITEREIDFERDPAMRDIASADSGPGGNAGGTSGTSSLDQMVKKAAAQLPAVSEEAAFYKAKAAYEVGQSNKQKQRQQVIDISFASVILILLAAVVYLFITRG
jgi:hypothetical protein